MRHTLVYNEATCFWCGRPVTACTCHGRRDSANHNAAANHQAQSQYQPAAINWTGAAVMPEPGGKHDYLPLPTMHALLRQQQPPVTNRGPRDEHDYLPLPTMDNLNWG